VGSHRAVKPSISSLSLLTSPFMNPRVSDRSGHEAPPPWGASQRGKGTDSVSEEWSRRVTALFGGAQRNPSN
jgi:hypothetical protein